MPNYSESFDIVKECNLEDKHKVAMERAQNSQMLNNENNILNKNPYTEVPDLLKILWSDKG